MLLLLVPVQVPLLLVVVAQLQELQEQILQGLVPLLAVVLWAWALLVLVLLPLELHAG